jgi:hypothetical protein
MVVGFGITGRFAKEKIHFVAEPGRGPGRGNDGDGQGAVGSAEGQGNFRKDGLAPSPLAAARLIAETTRKPRLYAEASHRNKKGILKTKDALLFES